MALKSEFWVKAFIRRQMHEGRFAALRQRGAEEAGAVFIKIDHLDGWFHLLGPAPGPSYDQDGERRFCDEYGQPQLEAAVETLLARRKKIDQDIWIIEVEDPNYPPAYVKIET